MLNNRGREGGGGVLFICSTLGTGILEDGMCTHLHELHVTWLWRFQIFGNWLVRVMASEYDSHLETTVL